MALGLAAVALTPTGAAACAAPGYPLHGAISTGGTCRLGLAGEPERIHCEEITADALATLGCAIDEAFVAPLSAEGETTKTIQFVQDTWRS